jgi:hypothetical protein
MEITWGVEGLEGRKLLTAKLSSAAASFCSMTSQRVVLEGVPAEDMAQFGFGADGADGAKGADGTEGADGAGIMIEGVFADGESRAIEVGSLNPTNDGYYVRQRGGATVYLASKYTIENILFDLKDILDLSIFDVAQEDVVRIEMDRGGTHLFIAEMNENGYEFDVILPIKAKLNVNLSHEASLAMEGLTAIAIEAVGATPGQLAEYGLDKPRYRLALGTADRVIYALLLGNEKTRGASIYCMVEDTDDVMSVSLENFGFLDMPIREAIEGFAYIVNINTVEHITVSFDGRVVEVGIATDDEDSANDVFTVDGVDVSDLRDGSGLYFKKFYQALIGATLYDVEMDAAPAPGPAEITFKYTLKEEPGEMLVEFVPKDDRLYYVWRNGQYAGITVEKRKFDADDGLRKTYAAMAAAMAAAKTGA